MTNNSIFFKIWDIIFVSGFFLYQLSFIRYLNSYISGYVPYPTLFIDYQYHSLLVFLLKLIALVISFLLFKYRKFNIYISSTFIWTILFIALSNEHDKYTFIGMFLIIFISFSAFTFKVASKIKK